MVQRDKRLALVIMAAGMGRRFGGPKQIEPVGPHGEWIVDYSVFDALRAGFDRVLFVIREDLEPILRDRFDAVLRDRCSVDFIGQRLDDLPGGFAPPADRVKPWGTGQAVLACRDTIHGPFAVINADDFYGRTGYRLLAGFLREGGGEHALVGYPLASTLTEHGTVSRGICRLRQDGYLDAIVERKRVARRDGAIAYSEDGETWLAIPDEATASMNMWGFAPQFFEALGHRFEAFLAEHLDTSAEFPIPTAVGNMIAEGATQVRVLDSSDAWFGVTYREDLERVRDGIKRLVASGAYPTPLWG